MFGHRSYWNNTHEYFQRIALWSCSLLPMMPRLWLMQPVLLHLSQMELTSIVAVHKGITSNYYQSDYDDFSLEGLHFLCGSCVTGQTLVVWNSSGPIPLTHALDSFNVVVLFFFLGGLCQLGMVHASSTSLSLWKTWSHMSKTKSTIQTTQCP